MARINPALKEDLAINYIQLQKLYKNAVDDYKNSVYKREMKAIIARIDRALVALYEAQQIIGE